LTSRVRLRSSRANGALSRGPKTAEGKLRSAGNRCTHGLYSNRVVLKHESQALFDKFEQKYIQAMTPQNDLELSAVRVMAAARWRLIRIRFTETVMLNDAIGALDPSISDPMARIAQAFSTLSDDPGFTILSPMEYRYSRQYHQAFQILREARARSCQPLPVPPAAEDSQKTENRVSIPLNEILTPEIQASGPPENRPNHAPTAPTAGHRACRPRQIPRATATRAMKEVSRSIPAGIFCRFSTEVSLPVP